MEDNSENKGRRRWRKSSLTTSFTETGAFNASTISPALADPALARILPNLSDIDPDLVCSFGEPPREGARFDGLPEKSQPVLTGGLLVVGRPYRPLVLNLDACEKAILRGGGIQYNERAGGWSGPVCPR